MVNAIYGSTWRENKNKNKNKNNNNAISHEFRTSNINSKKCNVMPNK